jgi:hypothetical protein
MSVTTPKPAAAPSPPWPGTRSDGVARLEIGGRAVDLPVVVGTEGEQGLDIAKLRAQTGAITLDEGFVNTGSTKCSRRSATSSR